MYLVTLDVTRTWITDPTDPGGPAIVCGSTQSSATESTLDAELVHYAGNRTQVAVYDQDDLTLHYTLKHLTVEMKERLLSWRGQIVLLRTYEGERVYCSFNAAPYRRVLFTDPEDGSDLDFTFEADVTFVKVSYTESV